MKIEKLIEAAKTAALTKLIPPEITVITRDEFGRMQLWWTAKPGKSPAGMATKTFNNLFLNVGGLWRSYDAQAQSLELGIDLTQDKAYCRKLTVIENRSKSQLANQEEKEFATSEFVSALLKKIFEGPAKQEAPKEVNQYEIKTIYAVDGLTFTDRKDAEEHVKCAKLFDLILESNPQAEYTDYQAVIENMVKNHDRFIAIMKG